MSKRVNKLTMLRTKNSALNAQNVSILWFFSLCPKYAYRTTHICDFQGETLYKSKHTRFYSEFSNTYSSIRKFGFP